ncbi:MAG: hypothetical protein ACPGLV_18185, partial [Bacteroidia bacterium]
VSISTVMKIFWGLVLCVLVLFQVSCGSKPTQPNASAPIKANSTAPPNDSASVQKSNQIVDESESVITHEIKGSENLVTLKNLRYHFEIDVPKNWKATDISGNGDGFNISIENCDAEISVFGESYNPDLLSMTFDLCNETADFTFSNEHSGTLCKSNNEQTAIMIMGNNQVSVYISDILKLTQQQRSAFETMRKSLRFTKRGVPNS